ncbi:MAG: hydrogenase nickel incorporation protein HypB [Acidobacteria bacterium]|nr:hydrogenase nickel incorporation protein HypB [Acidobacteriota bacterium]MCB9397626.1 hydrogenase nickel incorporation protein HypB [Acidobacteriota bacterium]
MTRIPQNWSLKEQNRQAAKQQQRLFDRAGCLVIELLGSPGCGKTSLQEATLPALDRCGVLNGDMASDRDIQRLKPFCGWAIQIETGNRCHLSASDWGVLSASELAMVDWVFVENVGNLVCPAAFPMGAHRRVLLVSTPEGHDKFTKYPTAIAAADLVVISKMELAPYVDFDADFARESIHSIKPHLPVLELSVRQQTGLEAWMIWLYLQRSKHCQSEVVP